MCCLNDCGLSLAKLYSINLTPKERTEKGQKLVRYKTCQQNSHLIHLKIIFGITFGAFGGVSRSIRIGDMACTPLGIGVFLAT